MIKYLNVPKFAQRHEIRKKLAVAHSELGKIHLIARSATLSAQYFHKALEFNNFATGFEDVYDNIVQCYHLDPDSVNSN